MTDLQDDARVYQVDFEPWDEAVTFLTLNGVQILGEGRISLPSEADPAIIVAALVGSGIRVSAFAPVRKSLEDLYLEITTPSRR
jgi:hypothetical protein